MLEDLPPEVVDNILTYLDPIEILKIGWCCQKLQTIANNEQVWVKCALRKYSIDLRNNTWDSDDDRPICLSSYDPYVCPSARIFTAKILMPLNIDFKEIWCLQIRGHYSGLGKLLYHNWCVYLVLLHPPTHPNTNHPLKPEILCCLRLKEDLPGSLRRENSFQFKEIFEPYFLNRKQTIRRGSPLTILKNESQPTVMKYTAYSKVQIFKSLKTKNTVIPPFCPIRPGLFKGTYGFNGIKVINVTYENDLKTLTGRKLTFVPNVPFDEISFEAYLDKMLILSSEDKSSFERIKDNMHSQENIQQIPSEKDQISRRFVYPQECQIDGLIDRDVFRRELWRFQARCQPAFTGYAEFFADPRFIDGNLIIFSEDIFGVMFIESQVLSIFERVKESLCDTQFSNVLQKLPEDDFDT